MATWCLVKCEAVVINDDPTKIPHHKRRGAIYMATARLCGAMRSPNKKGLPVGSPCIRLAGLFLPDIAQFLA
ncbi:hypothetical protein SAMN06273570_2559 [Candidatus Pantoea floridensis]|uniref:Uncharacterized protein n=1 Tax=Candidatus Pantoea floridensis TaxID=1938870 RepID=A0A286BVL0_9GAMM|nr:hypothetical protein BX596_4926 [Enterobacteriaceae bacterium JKS000233]SOD38168.1 hypothetical protein SAMN06273570_2559 [Pantoea floridensis]